MAIDLFNGVEPRKDVREGALLDSVFAASLEEVVAGTAPSAYGDAAIFFAGTYPSAGLRSLLSEVLGRLGGRRPDGAPVVRIETNLGGGKTHNLIALYHAALGRLGEPYLSELMDPTYLPKEPIGQVGVFVGTAAGATSFPEVTGTAPNTPWGYLALQIGGTAAYEHVRTDDENLTAPGAIDLKRVMGGRPTLILIDEIARYLAVAHGRIVGAKTLADQTIAFLMALMEAVSAQENACLVIATAQVTDAFGDETATVLSAVEEAQALIARKEHVLRPSEEADLPKILARRLFAHIDPSAPASVGAAYAEAATADFAAGMDLPEQKAGNRFGSEIVRCYPFHPDLITVLDKRLSTIPNFQRTRGALRLLARTVRHLWEAQPAGCQLIHLHHIDLADPDTVEDLSSRLDRGTFEPVIRADIASQPGAEPSHAEQVDHHIGAPFASRLATAAYLYSLTRDVPGVPAATLFGAVLAPGDDPNVIVKALDNLDTVAWYLHTDAHGYRFSVEPSLTKLIQEAESQVTRGQAKQAATTILTERFRDSALKVRRTWEDAKVPDHDDDAWLVILHWDEFGQDGGIPDPPEAPSQVTAIWERTPAGGVREYRNRLVFLVPRAASHEQMIAAVRHHLALKALAGSTSALQALPDEKRKEVANLAKQSVLEAAVAVCNHVNVMFVPQAGGLEPVQLDLVTTAGIRPNQTEALLERLSAMEKTLAEGDKPLDPAWIRQKLGAQMDASFPTIELVRAFARRPDLKLVLDRHQLVALVGAGVRNGVWEYHDLERGADGWATKAHQDGSYRLSETTTLEPVGTAPPPVPLGGTVVLPPLPPPSPAPLGIEFQGGGKADVALQEARQNAADAGRASVTGLVLSADPLGKGTAAELAKGLSVVPPSGGASRLRYDLRFTASFGDPADTLTVSFNALASDYQAVRAAFDNVLRSHEATVNMTIRAAFDPPLPLWGQEVEDLIRRAGDTGPSKCEVTLLTEPGS